MPKPDHYEVIWNGGELLPDRAEHLDDRLSSMPSYDLDDDQPLLPFVGPPRKYTRSGRHVGEFSRKQGGYIPVSQRCPPHPRAYYIYHAGTGRIDCARCGAIDIQP